MDDVSEQSTHNRFASVTRKRQTPTLATSLFTVKEAMDAGYGVFATQEISPQAELLISPSPSAYVIYRTFRKEVCAWCFKYETGRTWKVRFATNGAVITGGGMVFCSDECKQEWHGVYGDVGLEAYSALESFIQRQTRNQGWNSGGQDNANEEDGEPLQPPSDEEVDKVWTIIERQAALIRRHRLRTPLQYETKSNVKIEKKAILEALLLPAVDTDILFFTLSGLLCRFLSYHSSTLNAWDTLLMLNSSNPYTSFHTLYLVVNAYLQLLAILPLPLLHETVLNRDAIETVLTRDVGNSFGIWSTSDSQEDPEMLGYGIWPLASFFNHSCVPNVTKQRLGRKWVFNAAPHGNSSTVQTGTELCITYIRGEEDSLHVDDRRKKLQNGWGFTCQCSKCVHESTR